ncbi:peptidoglycan-binding domain-containing protein [Microcoleus sp. F6_B4]
MKLQNIVGTNKKLDVKAIAVDKELTRQIQIRLIDLGLLDPPANGIFGPVSTAALNRFHKLIQCTDEPGFIGAKTAEKLIEAKRSDLKFPPPVLKIVKETFLKARPIDALNLSDAEKQKCD